MLKKIFFCGLIISLSSLFSCEDETNKNNADAAFNKIDSKNKNAFTSADRKKKYDASIASSEKVKSSLKQNASYNGYGASSSPKKSISSSKKKEKVATTESSPTKTKPYRPKSINSQVYSAYSTN